MNVENTEDGLFYDAKRTQPLGRHKASNVRLGRISGRGTLAPTTIMLEQAIRDAKQRLDIKAQHGPVRVIMKDGKVVDSATSS